MVDGAVDWAPLMGLMLAGSDRPISVPMMTPAMSKAKKIMRVAKPNMRPTPTSTAMTPINPQKSPLSDTEGGRVGPMSAAMSAPRARRIWTGKLAVEKTGKTDSMALTRRKTIIQLVRSSIMSRRHFWFRLEEVGPMAGRGYWTICGIFWIMAVGELNRWGGIPRGGEKKRAAKAGGFGKKGGG